MANNKKIPYFCRVVLQNFPFIEEDFDALTTYQLISKVVEYLNKVIKSQNTLVDNVNDLNLAFQQLHDYVENYFENLDVQEEINNKLDEMAEAGTLQEIITAYIQANVAWCFDTVADMKAATNLVAGSYAQTLGFYTINDGGGATYYITDSGTADEMQVIAVGDLYANLVLPGVITPEMLGAKGDNTTDDTAPLQKAINLGSKVKLTKQYAVDYLTLHSDLELTGEDGASIRGNASHWLIYHETDTTPIKNVTIKDIKLTGYGVYTGSSMGEDTTKDAGIVIQYGNNITIDNCVISNFGEVAIRLDAITNAEVKNNKISSDLDYSSGGAIPNYSFGVQVDGDNIHVDKNNITGYIHGVINGAYTSNLYIEGNLISQRHQHGIYLSSGTNILVKGNIINSQTNAICGVKLQTNVLGQRIYNAVITDNLITSGQSAGAQGILVCSYNQAPYAIEKVIIANNKIYAQRGAEIENVIDLLIDSNIIESSNSNVACYGIRIYNSTLANIPARITNVISNNNISAIQPVRTEYKDLGSKIRFSLNGNHIYVPLSSVVLTRTCVNIYQYADVLDIRNNYLEGAVSDTPTTNFSDGIYFGVNTCTKVILMSNYSDGFRWGCRNANSYDAEKIVNVGNAFNTEVNITE